MQIDVMKTLKIVSKYDFPKDLLFFLFWTLYMVPKRVFIVVLLLWQFSDLITQVMSKGLSYEEAKYKVPP